MADTVYHFHSHSEEKSLGDLFSELSKDIQSLVGNEIKLAKIEMKMAPELAIESLKGERSASYGR